MLVKGAFVKLFKADLAWTFFCLYYPKRKKAKSKRVYYKERRAAFKKWIANFPTPYEDE